MSRNKKSGKDRQKKTAAQANKCNNELGSRTTQIENTYGTDSHSYLCGTDEPMERRDDAEKPKPKKLRYKVGDWFKENIVTALVGAGITAIIGFVFWGVIDLKADMKVVDTKITGLQEDVDKLATDSVSKEILDLQIKALKDSLEARWLIDGKELENQIELIRQQIEFVEEKLADYEENKKE